MSIEFTPYEIRVIGCLIEKEITTPEQYPLSLNALVNACNQKSNREPVLDLDAATVQGVVDGLVRKFQVHEHGGFGSRVPKFQHRFCNSTYGTLKFSPQELAIVCELFLRGPQTPGELRTHAGRLCRFGDASDVEEALTRLAEREGDPVVVRLPREPGKREARYAHLFGGDRPVADKEEFAAAAAMPAGETPRPEDGNLERRVAALEAEVAALKRLIEDLASGGAGAAG